jgi:uncharacterized MAPEG superfamily protein
VLNTPVFNLYALVATLIAFQLLLLGGYTGAVRNRVKKTLNAEDVTTLKQEGVEVEHPDVQRTQRAHRNAIESAVPFFAVGLLYALSGPSTLGAQAYFFTFLAARVLHSIFYLAGKQPFRTISFAIGVATIFGMGVHVIRASI